MDIEGLNRTPNTAGWRFDTCAAQFSPRYIARNPDG
jgi:hypothetical protein